MLGLIFPARCVICNNIMERGAVIHVCEECRRRHIRSGGEHVVMPGGTACYYAAFYDGRVRESFLRYKFRGRTQAAVTYAALMADALALEREVDIVTWVPVSARRGFMRGYDQSKLLCKGIARRIGMRAVKTLRKRRHNTAQSGITDRSERSANVIDAYSIRKSANVKGKSVLLADDVLTTGATMSECVKVLYRAGAAHVTCIVFAYSKKERNAF